MKNDFMLWLAGWVDGPHDFTISEMRSAWNAGAAHEREECAKLVRAGANDMNRRVDAYGKAGKEQESTIFLAECFALRHAEDAIRARGKA